MSAQGRAHGRMGRSPAAASHVQYKATIRTTTNPAHFAGLTLNWCIFGLPLATGPEGKLEILDRPSSIRRLLHDKLATSPRI